MSCYDNHHLIPSFSPEFEEIHALWKELMKSLESIADTSAFNIHTNGASFEGGKTVFSYSEIAESLQSILAFLRKYNSAMKKEAHHYLEYHRGFLWFYYAMQALYHPSEEDRKNFAMFFEGSWGEFGLSYSEYVADKERKETRGKTKNPKYIDTHVCCSNCICFYDDTPDYEWSKEDREESEASNNIRINWDKKAEFERRVLEKGVLETWRDLWETWSPPIRPISRSLALDEYWVDHLKTTVAVAAYYAKRIWWTLPHEFYFSFLWDNQHTIDIVCKELEEALGVLQARYEKTKEWEDEIIEAARGGIKHLQVSNCFFEEESRMVY